MSSVNIMCVDELLLFHQSTMLSDLQEWGSMKWVSMSMSIKSADDMENVASLSHSYCFSEIITTLDLSFINADCMP